MSCLSSFSLALTLFSSYALAAGPIASRANTLQSKLGPVVDLGYAAYAGNDTLGDVVFYGGIPYIEPPVGDLRFAAPKQLDETRKSLKASDIVDARTWGPICIQQPAVEGFGQEDCITLDVWVPAGCTTSSKLPVYVYIHGGGYYYNSAVGFPGDEWVAKSNGGLIFVGIQYRLGLLGFLAGDEVANDTSSAVNNGLMDQRAALEWIQRNIAAFGGDPTKVTIGGESAGGGSVALHLTAYGGETHPPFRAAVIESAGNDPFYTAASTQTCFDAVTESVGCDTADDVMACWKALDVSMIVYAVNNKPSTCKFEPIIDGKYVTGITSQLITAGKFSKVPILAGHNAQDGSIFVGKPAAVTTDADIQAAVAKRYTYLSQATLDEMLEIYPEASATTPWTTQWERAMYAYMESELACYDYYIGQKSGKPTYNYVWGAPDPNLIASRGEYVGTCHTAELFYLFQGTNSGPSSAEAEAEFTPFNTTEAALADTAVAWWSSFARDLNPNTHAVAGAPTWNTASSGSLMSATLSLNEMIPFEADFPRRCEWWVAQGNELRL